MIFIGIGLLLAIGFILFFITTDNFSQFGASPSGARLERIQKSPNYNGEKFVNPNSIEQNFSFSDIREMIPRWFNGKEMREPKYPLPIFKLDSSLHSAHDSTRLSITWLGHTTALIEIDGRRVLTDPVWAERYSPTTLWGPKRFHPVPIALEALPKLDAVVISHDHYDHLDKNAIQALAKTGVTFYLPLGVGAHLESWGVPLDQIIELDWWEKASSGDGLDFIALPAVHFSGRLRPSSNNTLWATWAIIGRDHRVYFGGDTGYFDGLAEIGEKYGPFDMAFMPIGAYGEKWPAIHLTPEQAAAAHMAVKGGLMVPSHWGTFNLAFHDWFEPPERLARAVEATGIRAVIPRAGQCIDLDSRPHIDFWWRECE